MEISTKSRQAGVVIEKLQEAGIVGNNVTVRNETYYLITKKAGLVSGGGVTSLITNQTKIEPGVSSFDHMPLPQGKTLIINAIRIKGSTDTTASVKPANAKFVNSETAIENSLRNSDFIIRQDGDLFRVPIRRISSTVESQDVDYDFMQLVKPITLLPNVPFSFNIESALDATPVTDGYLLVEFDVTVTESGVMNSRRAVERTAYCR